MNYQNPIFTEKTQCQDCYKCIRECPVKAIRVENGHAMIIDELCVLCGHCVQICPAGAKRVRDDLGRARQLLTFKKRVVISVAPSFVSEFPNLDGSRFATAVKKLGFFGISETAIGADLVSAQLSRDFSEKESSHQLYISSACPTVVEYIKLYMSDLSPYITDRASPLLAHTRFLRELYGEDIGIIFVGPCISKKREADVWPSIDTVISFKDLSHWFSEAGIDPYTCEADSQGFIPFKASKGSLYPIDGGMIAAVKKYHGTSHVHMMSVTGLDQIDSFLRGLTIDDLSDPLFIELLSCEGGCINGPLCSSKKPAVLRRISLLEYAKDAPQKSFAEEKSDQVDMCGTIPGEALVEIAHTGDEIRNALRQVGKLSIEDELNCGSCGYDTCRTFAAAMLDERAEKTMCVSYMRKLAQKKANGLIRAIPSGVVICDSDLTIIECNENFARIMGSEALSIFEAKPGMEGADFARITGMSKFFTDVMAVDGPDVVEHEFREGKKIFQISVFSIEKGESACGVIQDVTAPQIQRDRVIRQTKKVIEKNLAVVQKIAFLLGENAAETEITLSSVIQSFSVGEEGDA